MATKIKPIISLTSIPSRINALPEVLDSLLKQGYPVHLFLPRTFARTGQTFGGCPKALKKYKGRVKIHFVNDIGPATKLLPALQEGFDTVITADDDNIYGDGWARGLVKQFEKRKNTVVCYRGRVLRKGDTHYSTSIIVENPKRARQVDIVTGVHGAIYSRDMFGPEVFIEWRRCFSNDDIFISAHLRARGVKLMAVPRKCDLRKTKMFNVDALGKTNNGGRENDELTRRYYGGK